VTKDESLRSSSTLEVSHRGIRKQICLNGKEMDRGSKQRAGSGILGKGERENGRGKGYVAEVKKRLLD